MSDTLSGFLMWGDSVSVKSAIPKISRLKRTQSHAVGWNTFDYELDTQIPGVDVENGPPFSHPVLIRSGADRIIILSHNHRVCDHLIEKELRREVHSPLKKADILVHELVVALCQFRRSQVAGTQVTPDGKSAGDGAWDVDWEEFNLKHLLGYGYARSDAFGGNLQKIEFEGEDLSLVPLFIDAIPFLRFRNCGLRQKSIDERGFPSSFELLRLGKRGFLSFPVPSSDVARNDRFSDVEAALRSLNRFGYVK